ncbi:MAG: hypothetical protein LIO81_09735 [Clostridiales bacterium]|nr:hypothetical protein [Clostridiales bacterium]
MKAMKKKLALAMAAVIAVGSVPSLPSVWAKPAKEMEIVNIRELPEETLYQQVEYGTKKRSLDLPRYLYAEIREVGEDADDTDDTDDGSVVTTATASNASVARKATASNAEKKTGTKTATATPSNAAVSTATPSDATPSDAEEDDFGNWKRVRINWILNESFSEQEEYDGEAPGIYVFEAELARDRYVLGEAELPQIEIEVLEKEAEAEPFAWETEIDGVRITLTADPGVFPEDAEVFADRIEDDYGNTEESVESSGKAQQAIQAVLEKSAVGESAKSAAGKSTKSAAGEPTVMEIREMWLFDISVQDKDGKTIQPDRSAGNAELAFTLTGTGEDVPEDDEGKTMLQLFSMERGGNEVKALSEQTVEDTVSTDVERFARYPLVKLRAGSVRYVARIGDTEYETVGAAVQSVAGSAKTTIVMTGDSEESVSIVVDGSRQIVLDLAGYTLTGPEDACAIIIDGPDASLTLNDSSDEKTGTVNGRAGGISTQDGGTFIMAGGVVSW